jgi:uncharacterized protein YdeI (YjbR/CyaY-like superfamily)
MQPRFFKTPADLRRWFVKHAADEMELLVGYYKRDTNKASVTWPESVDQALCFGWIDGVRKRIDDQSYTIRFAPRKPRSIWSAVNVRRMKELIRRGEATEAGLRAFAEKRENRSGKYSFEQRSVDLPPEYAKVLNRDKAARTFFESQPPSYRKTAFWWVVSAKKEETRLRRLQQLIADSARGERIGPLRKQVGIKEPPSDSGPAGRRNYGTAAKPRSAQAKLTRTRTR